MVSMYLLAKINNRSKDRKIEIGLHRKGPIFFLVTKTAVAQNVKDTERKWIAHGWNHRQKFIGIFQFVTDKMYFW